MSFTNYLYLCLGLLLFAGCESFEEFNTNPNEPTSVSPEVLLPGAIRQSVNTSVDAAFLVGNNAAQLTAKTLRLEVDAYNWNSFPTYWEGWFGSLTDVIAVEKLAIERNNEALEGAAITLRTWIYANLTNAYGDIPYAEAIGGTGDVFTPRYDDQAAIYRDMLSELGRASALLASGSGSISGDILLNGDPERWRRFANSLRLRLLMLAGDRLDDAADQFASIVANEPILASNGDNVTLAYTGSFPNEFPLVPLKTGDFDAVALSATALDVMEDYGDPRVSRYARPNNDEFGEDATFIGAENGQGASCEKSGASRLGVQFYDYPDLQTADQLGLPMAEGIVMTYSEVLFLRAEAAAKGWTDDDVETRYREGILASMDYWRVDFGAFGYDGFGDYYDNSGVAYAGMTDIWEQKWLALFFTGLEPYFELRRWYVASGKSFAGVPFVDATCENLNDDRLPLRFLYPGQEQSLNAANYEATVNDLGGNTQNAEMWLVE